MGQVEIFINLLTKKTEEKRVTWVETDYEDTYEAEFSHSRLRLTPLRGLGDLVPPIILKYQNAYPTRPNDLPITLEIHDQDGNLIETLGINQLGEEYINSNVIHSMSPSSTLRTLLRDIEDRDVSPSLRRLYRAVRRQLAVPSAVISELIDELEEK